MLEVDDNCFPQKILQITEQTVAPLLNEIHITEFHMCTIIGKISTCL